MLMINKLRLFTHTYVTRFFILVVFYGLISACKLLLPGYLALGYAPVMLALLGAFGGAMGSYVLGIRSLLLLGSTLCGLSVHPFFGLPTVCASLYWSTDHRWLQIAMPACCMLLFVLHPVGYCAAPYTLFWLIPIIVACTPCSSLLVAFGSTFTAHAIGSVMHLYLLNSLSAHAWLALMPLVVLERSILALSMWVAYVCLQRLFSSRIVTQQDESWLTPHVK